VYQVIDLSSKVHIERELLLLKVVIDNNKDEIEIVVKQFGGSIISDKDGVFVIELVNTSKVVNEFISEFDASKITAVSRTGVTGVCIGD
jgi:acetolactate synthase small subunit